MIFSDMDNFQVGEFKCIIGRNYSRDAITPGYLIGHIGIDFFRIYKIRNAAYSKQLEQHSF